MNTSFNSNTQSYQSEIMIDMEGNGNYQQEGITETQNEIFTKVYRKSKQIKPYKNTKEGRKKCAVNKVLGKNYKETSELLITDKNLMVGGSYALLIENKIKGAKYQWSSGNKSVATVTQNGKITAVSGGNTVIACRVTKGKKSYSLKCKLYVIDHSDEAITAYYAVEKDGYIYQLNGGVLERINSLTGESISFIVNIIEGKKFILYGNYLYFLSWDNNESSYLIRADLEGKKTEILCRADFLFGAEEGRIYYGCPKYLADEDELEEILNYITVDGKEYKEYENVYKTEWDFPGEQVIIKEGYLYDIDPDGRLNRFNLNTKETEILAEERVTEFQVEKNYIYYSQMTGELWKENMECGLYRMDLGSKLITELCSVKNVQLVLANTDDEWIYYWINSTDTHGIYQIRKDGTDSNKMLEVREYEEKYLNYIKCASVFKNGIACVTEAYNGEYYGDEAAVQFYKFDGFSWNKIALHNSSREVWCHFDYVNGCIYYGHEDDFFVCSKIDLSVTN